MSDFNGGLQKTFFFQYLNFLNFNTQTFPQVKWGKQKLAQSVQSFWRLLDTNLQKKYIYLLGPQDFSSNKFLTNSSSNCNFFDVIHISRIFMFALTHFQKQLDHP